MDDVVTGEAVALDLRPASFASRAMGLFFDVLAQVVLAVALIVVGLRVVADLDTAAQQAMLGVLLLVVVVGVPVTVETLTRGRSLGKLITGLRVVRDDGGPIRFRHALLRGLIATLEIYLLLGSPALIASLATPRGQRVGDLAAGTYVVRERTGARGGRRAEMPPELRVWAEGADIGRLPGDLALGMRRFVSGAGAMHPGARTQLGRQLAREASSHVMPAPPPGTSPENFLEAVLAERYRRDLERLRQLRERRIRQSAVTSPGAPTATPQAPTSPVAAPRPVSTPERDAASELTTPSGFTAPG